MSRPGFLNDNEARAYPFADDGAEMLRDGTAYPLPHSAIVDFGCIVGLDAGFDDRMHSVRLGSIARVGDAFTFEFLCDAPGLVDHALRFSRTLADPEFASEDAEAVPLVAATPDPCVAIRDDPLWEGWLATGLLGDLDAILPPGGTLEAGPVAPLVEPAAVQNLALGYVRTINLANEDRTRATAPAGCPEGSSEHLGDPEAPDHQYRTVVNSECLSGPQVVRAGYNCAVRQNARENSLTISAALAAGAGQPCVEVKLNGDESPPAGSSLLTGGPACGELVTSINGLAASVLHLVPLQGVQIVPSDTAPNMLIVDIDLHDLTICPGADQGSAPPPAPG